MHRLNTSKKTKIRSVFFCFQRLCIVSLAVVFALLPGSGEPYQTLPLLSARSAILMDLDSAKIIASKAPHMRRAPASTVKILTALVVEDQVDLNRIFVTGRRAAMQPSTNIKAHAGERFTVRALLHALLIGSANDAAVILAEGVSGTEAQFAKLMNEKARQLGARNSHFRNASGLPDDEQYSTAYDLAIFVREATKSTTLTNIMKKRRMTIRSEDGRTIELKNHNKMMWRDPRPLFGKTGWTRKSRHCFAGRIVHENKDVCLVTMGSVKPWTDLRKLLDYTFGYTMNYRVHRNRALMTGKYVKKLQTNLKKLGFDPGALDGKVGPNTVKAIISFQQANGLAPDGIAGPRTQERLEMLA